MSLRALYLSDVAAGKDTSAHDGRPRPQEYCSEPAIGPPDDETTYQLCGAPATDTVADTDGRTYAMCSEHAARFRQLMAYLQATRATGESRN